VNDANTAKVLEAISAIGAKIDGLDRRLAALEQEASQTKFQVSEIKGQNSIIVAWMTSMDQRFAALMAPYQPPKPPKADAA